MFPSDGQGGGDWKGRAHVCSGAAVEGKGQKAARLPHCLLLGAPFLTRGAPLPLPCSQRRQPTSPQAWGDAAHDREAVQLIISIYTSN